MVDSMTTDKLPPHDITAEESVISSLLIDGEAIKQIENIIVPDDFYHEISRYLYSSCVELRGRRESINQVTLAQELARVGKLEECGGAAYLSHIISECPTSLDIEYYAIIVHRLSVSRQLIKAGDGIATVGYKAEPDVNKSMSDASRIIQDLTKKAIIFNELVSPKDSANVIFDMISEYNQPDHSMSWGYRDMDNLTSGIYPELYIIGGRPSVGKTQILIDILENVANKNYHALFCSAEMSVKSIMERKISRELKLDIRKLRRSGLDADLMDKLTHLSGEVSQHHVYYMSQGISSQDIYNEATKLKDNIGLDIVFVDYLQILKDCWQIGRENKTVLVGRACKTLKLIVTDLQIPVICASQLNRELEHRAGDSKKPVLADLRESGDIEQDADVVFLLWRNLDSEDINTRNILELKMAKNRQLGDAPYIELNWLSAEHRYVDAVWHE